MPEKKSLITISDIRSQGYCVRGVRLWFNKHDLDFQDFLKNGISEEKFISQGDGIAEEIVNRKQGMKRG